MNLCRHCGHAIAQFQFKSSEGKQWWHFSDKPYLYCNGHSGQVAAP